MCLSSDKYFHFEFDAEIRFESVSQNVNMQINLLYDYRRP